MYPWPTMACSWAVSCRLEDMSIFQWLYGLTQSGRPSMRLVSDWKVIEAQYSCWIFDIFPNICVVYIIIIYIYIYIYIHARTFLAMKPFSYVKHVVSNMSVPSGSTGNWVWLGRVPILRVPSIPLRSLPLNFYGFVSDNTLVVGHTVPYWVASSETNPGIHVDKWTYT